jgi:tetratricopeptide (TPR) repeat protein
MIQLNLGELYRSRGELAAARQMYERSLRIYQDLRYTLAVALLNNNLAAVAIAEQRWDRAAERLVKSEQLFSEIGSDDFKAELIRHRAELSLGRGLIGDALTYAQQAIVAAEDSQEKLEIGLSRRVLGQAFLAQHDLAGAEHELQTSLDVLESIGSPVEAANTRVVLAQLRGLQGRGEDARQLLDAAIETYDAVGADALKAHAQIP